MSLASSAVTYTSVYTNAEPRRVFWGADGEISDGVSSRVIVPRRATTQDEDEHELMFIQPHDPDFVPEPIYPEYVPLEDEHILPAEEQPLPPIVSPTAESPEYVVESDPEEDPKEYEEDETEDGPVDFLMDGGDDDEIDSSGYDADDEDEVEEEEDEEEEEHLASADSATSISLPLEAEVKRLLAMPTLPPSPLTSLSPPSAGERLARCTAPATLPLPILPPSLYPPPVDRRDDILESEQPPRTRLCLSYLGSRYEVGESSTRGRGKVNTRVTELAELHEHDTQDLYALLEDAQDGRTRISHRVAMDSQRVDLLMGDRMTLQETVWIMEEEAYAYREAWAHSVGLSQTVHHELQTFQTLRVMRDMRREMGDMQAELLALCGQPRRAGQSGGDVRVPNHQDAPKDADSHI
nr:hypothetical protein [Tanacetum cinerariifolium]